MEDYIINFNGELYYDAGNQPESDAQTALDEYIKYGVDSFNTLNGAYAFSIWDKNKRELILVRDRLGVKSLFYTIKDGFIVYSSKIRDLLKFPGVEAVIDGRGLCEIMGLGPARTQGIGVFKDIFEIKAGHYGIYNSEGFKQIKYWGITSRAHTDDFETTVEKTSGLIRASVQRQMKDDVCLGSLLSGGLDSGIVTGLICKTSTEKLKTYSFDYIDNDKYFMSNAFQPDQDRPWVEKMVKEFNTDHKFMFCDSESLFEKLYDSVDCKDLPGMGDVDSSLLYFCEKVSEDCKIVFSGECADEIFGGYPWFHKKEYLEADTFPWSMDLDLRRFIFKKELWDKIKPDEYVQKRYFESLGDVPALDTDSTEEKKRREIAYLNLKWFMSTLLYRMEKAAEETGITARVPFADYKIVEYVFNVPWDMKCRDGIVKGLLRHSCKDILPDDILNRKKSPFPKTYNPHYEELLSNKIKQIINSGDAPVLALLDTENVKKLLEAPTEYDKPWFGQLMAVPQLMAYIIQINYWLIRYNIKIVT